MYRLRSTVTVVEVLERFRTVAVSGVAETAVTRKESLGWWIRLDNRLVVNAGDERPPLKAGDVMQWILEQS